MHTEKQNSQCDERQLRAYLDRELATTEEIEVEQHLSECSECQRIIRDSAVEPQWWSDASRYLSRDELDEALTHSSAFSVADSTGDESGLTLPTVIRQIREWLDATDDPKYIGRFGGYEILGAIGHGGMGVVLKGFEPSLNRYVAIKLLAPSLASTGAARKRFAREAQAAAAVLHENVIAIHRVDESNGLPYLVMPYVNGLSLQKRIDVDGPLPLPAILRIGRQISAGLAAAHAQGLVHRDIKPANILLDRGVERVTITDFGLARAADDGSVTRTGVIAGTPQYMSPEQARGEALDARSDLFSLGSVLYAMATGHPPFRAETGYGVLRRITDGQPRSIREVNAEIPEWFEAVVCRLHAKSPADRFRSAAEVADLLEQCLAHLQQPTIIPLPESVIPDLKPPRGRQPTNKRGYATNRIVHRVTSWCRRRSRIEISMAGAAAISLVCAAFFLAPKNDTTTERTGQQSQSTAATPSQEPDALVVDPNETSSTRTHWEDDVTGLLQSFSTDASRLEQRATEPLDDDSFDRRLPDLVNENDLHHFYEVESSK